MTWHLTAEASYIRSIQIREFHLETSSRTRKMWGCRARTPTMQIACIEPIWTFIATNMILMRGLFNFPCAPTPTATTISIRSLSWLIAGTLIWLTWLNHWLFCRTRRSLHSTLQTWALSWIQTYTCARCKSRRSRPLIWLQSQLSSRQSTCKWCRTHQLLLQ